MVARFDTITLRDDGPDRVRIGVVRGEPAPETLKVGVNHLGGYRNSFTFCLTGLDIEAKATLLEEQIWSHVPGGRDAFAFARTQLVRTDHDDPATNEAATALLRVTVKDPDERLVGGPSPTWPSSWRWRRSPASTAWAGRARPARTACSGRPPCPPTSCPQTVTVDGRVTVVGRPPAGTAAPAPESRSRFRDRTRRPCRGSDGPGADREGGRGPLRRQGGNANLGVFARSAEGYAWLSDFLTVARLRELMPAETAGLEVGRYELPNLRALNFVIVGLLEEGVAGSSRMDGRPRASASTCGPSWWRCPLSLLDGPP